MHTTNRLSCPAAYRGGHPASDRIRPPRERRARRQHVIRPQRAHASYAVASRPATSEHPRMATLLATSASSIGDSRVPARVAGRACERVGERLHRVQPRRSHSGARWRRHHVRTGMRGRSGAVPGRRGGSSIILRADVTGSPKLTSSRNRTTVVAMRASMATRPGRKRPHGSDGRPPPLITN